MSIRSFRSRRKQSGAPTIAELQPLRRSTAGSKIAAQTLVVEVEDNG